MPSLTGPRLGGGQVDPGTSLRGGQRGRSRDVKGFSSVSKPAIRPSLASRWSCGEEKLALRLASKGPLPALLTPSLPHSL